MQFRAFLCRTKDSDIFEERDLLPWLVVATLILGKTLCATGTIQGEGVCCSLIKKDISVVMHWMSGSFLLYVILSRSTSTIYPTWMDSQPECMIHSWRVQFSTVMSEYSKTSMEKKFLHFLNEFTLGFMKVNTGKTLKHTVEVKWVIFYILSGY